ncbi:DUF368 domain-containing protein [Bacteroidota bacterium]
MKTYISIVFKGIAMGIANVIPGVSGGTIALITGIFERLINAIKSFNLIAIKLLLKGKIRDLWKHTDLNFLIALISGVIIAVVSVARLFGYLFDHYPVYIWAYFFGLVLASVYFVGISVSKWTFPVILTFIIGTAIAIIISVLSPATENSGFIYLLICGVAAVCSMILPGLSGSFILVLMGNYQLIFIDAVNERNLTIWIPVLIGAAAGLLAFSYLLSWVFKKYRNETISLLTGFILGSLAILWPWKNTIFLVDNLGQKVLKKGEPIVIKYERILPESFNNEVFWAIIIAIAGILSIWAVERFAQQKEKVDK